MALILAVDDRAINREFLATLLGYVGHEVVQASDGAEALDVMRERRPDLVITDVMMPVMGGVEFADRVHDDPEIAHTPIIFYTATYRVIEARVLAQSCRVEIVLAKPAEPQEILDAVDSALGLDRYVSLTRDPGDPRQKLPAVSLPDYLRDLTELQRRLRQSLDRAVRQYDTARGAQDETPEVSYAFHSLSLRIAALIELDLTLAAERDPEMLLTLFCSGAQDIMNCRYAAVGVLAEGGAPWRYFTSRGLSEQVQAEFASVDPSAGLLGRVVASGKPHRARFAPGDPPAMGLPESHPPITSLLAVPVPVRSATALTGWIYFADPLGKHSFEGEDEQFAVTLAAQFSLAFGNLVLYDEVQKHAAKLEIEVAERRRAQEEIIYRSTHDQTTGLPRFVLIEEYLEGIFVDGAHSRRRAIVLYVDMDHFHTINDTRGRAAGDSVLRIVADRLRAITGSQGKVAHVGGDEFAVALVDDDRLCDEFAFAEAVRKRIEEPMWHEGQRIYATCSVGVCCFPDNGLTPQELLRQAEAAMLRSQREGRNLVSAFRNEQKHAIEERATLGSRLSDAILDGQLVPHYQPQIDATDGRVLGFEALVRWDSPEFGLLTPGRFLGVAEELGLIVDLGNFMLGAVCRDARTCLDAGFTDFLLAINISALQLQRPDFADKVAAALAEADVPAHHIELELTEGMVVGNVERAIATMRALKALGVQLALDDFGTGYSSLNYLRRFPIDKLKIDQSFVQDLGSDAGAAGICSAVITLGHQLGMKVLAEGVETEAQSDFLRNHGCDQFQGYYFGRPAAADRMIPLLRRGWADAGNEKSPAL